LIRTIVLLVVSGFISGVGFGQAKVWEEDLAIPTWVIGPPEVNPTFSWSSSRQEVYPYAYKETLTDEKTDKTYRACWLENEYIKVLILPEIGGRLHGAQDKTNGYNFFYWQPTIKPALVGMTGAWISGGIEWNFPHGHRPTGFSRVQYRIVDNPDGSKTVWVGEPELVQRMRWIVGLTIYPGKSVIEAKVRLSNPSPIRQSFQMWTTTATHANDDYQLVYPTRLMTGHGKTEYWHWPIDNGVDISWYKNVPNAASYFAVEPGPFFGGWDHGKNAGTVIVGNPNIVIGKKFWTWGTAPFGQLWEPILTDGGGPYAEPQAGGYSDNQPDYHWMEPGDIKVYSHYFFPARDIGPFKVANVNGALNLEAVGNQLKVGVYSTAVLKGAKVSLTLDGKSLLDRTMDLDPGHPLVELLTPGQIPADLIGCRLSLSGPDGESLIVYRPEKKAPVDLPEPMAPFAAPDKVKTNDELWHAGDWYYKFREPERGREYFEEAIKRDPGDSRSRLSLAELEIKRARYEEALKHLSVAQKRDPDDGKLFYLQGLSEEGLKKYEVAYDHFYRAVHFEDYLSRAYQRLTEIDLRNEHFQDAADHVSLALDKNALSPELWALKAASLRYLGDLAGAEKSALRAVELDPLNAQAVAELLLTKRSQRKAVDGDLAVLKGLLHNSQTALEFSLAYSDAGLYEEAFFLLEQVPDDALVLYHKAYLRERQGRPAEAQELFRKARSASVDYAFAFRMEDLDAFEAALRNDPSDSSAAYLKGLVYAKLADVDRAVEAWNRAVTLNPKQVRAWRDLGLAALRVSKDTSRALDCYTKAFAIAPTDSRILLEFDEVREKAGLSAAERLALFNQNRSTVESRDELVARLVDLLLNDKKYEEALGYLTRQHFNSWEGGYSIHNSYMEANIGMASITADPKKALDYYQQACLYPRNLEVAPREPNLRGFLYYPMALLQKKLGNQSEAQRLLEVTAKEESEYPTLGTYYQALALRELGKKSEADALMGALKAEADAMIKGDSKAYQRTGERLRTALGHYYRSRVMEAEGNKSGAASELQAAQRTEPDIERQAVMLAQRVYARAHQ